MLTFAAKLASLATPSSHLWSPNKCIATKAAARVECALWPRSFQIKFDSRASQINLTICTRDSETLSFSSLFLCYFNSRSFQFAHRDVLCISLALDPLDQSVTRQSSNNSYPVTSQQQHKLQAKHEKKSNLQVLCTSSHHSTLASSHSNSIPDRRMSKLVLKPSNPAEVFL